jgi:hypothetical protein
MDPAAVLAAPGAATSAPAQPSSAEVVPPAPQQAEAVPDGGPSFSLNVETSYFFGFEQSRGFLAAERGGQLVNPAVTLDATGEGWAPGSAGRSTCRAGSACFPTFVCRRRSSLA